MLVLLNHMCQGVPSTCLSLLTSDTLKLWHACMQVVLPDQSKADRDIVVFLDEAQAARTSEEAQERAAVAALARVAGHRNMQRVLPRAFQAAWTWCVQQVRHLLSPKAIAFMVHIASLVQEQSMHIACQILDSKTACVTAYTQV